MDALLHPIKKHILLILTCEYDCEHFRSTYLIEVLISFANLPSKVLNVLDELDVLVHNVQVVFFVKHRFLFQIIF